jgi:Mrp family chromosome partitioning ATPase
LLLDSRAVASQPATGAGSNETSLVSADGAPELVPAGHVPDLWIVGKDATGAGKDADAKAAGADSPLVVQVASVTSDAMGVLEKLKNTFDVVVLDAGPVLSAPETVRIVPHVDGVIFAIRSGSTRMPDASAAIHQLRLLGAPILGAVLLGSNENAYESSYQLRPQPAT